MFLTRDDIRLLPRAKPTRDAKRSNPKASAASVPRSRIQERIADKDDEITRSLLDAIEASDARCKRFKDGRPKPWWRGRLVDEYA